MLLNSHISVNARCLAGKVCGLVRSTWGTSQGEDKLGARGRILNTKVVHRACAGRTRANIPPSIKLYFTLKMPHCCPAFAQWTHASPVVGGFQGRLEKTNRLLGAVQKRPQSRPWSGPSVCQRCEQTLVHVAVIFPVQCSRPPGPSAHPPPPPTSI